MKAHDYIKLAKAIKAHRTGDPEGDTFIHEYGFINDLCDILAADNKNFDKERFLEAVK